MKIGILSDSHKQSDFQKIALDKLIQEGVQYILHSGDLEIEENLKMLNDTKLPYVAVFGNNDKKLITLSNQYNIKQEPYYFKIKELKIKIMHMPYYMTPDTDLVIYGHTHQFSYEKIRNTLFINPGEICAREKNISECVLLEVSENNWNIKRLYRNIEKLDWESKVINISRE